MNQNSPGTSGITVMKFEHKQHSSIVPQLEKLRQDLHDHMDKLIGQYDLRQDGPDDADDGKNFWKNAHSVLVALDGETVVGFITLELDPDFKETVDIGYLQVHEDYRHRGIGQLLVTGALEQAKLMKIKHVSIGTWANNINAVRLYEQMGFKPYTVSLLKKLK